jgi:hypothetical protein
MRPVSPALARIQRAAYPAPKTPIYLAHRAHAEVDISWMNLFRGVQSVRTIALPVERGIVTNALMDLNLMIIMTVYCRMDMAGVRLRELHIIVTIGANTVQFRLSLLVPGHQHALSV